MWKNALFRLIACAGLFSLAVAAQAASIFDVRIESEFSKVVDTNTAVLTTNATSSLGSSTILEGLVWVPGNPGYLIFSAFNNGNMGDPGAGLRRLVLPSTLTTNLTPPAYTVYNGNALDNQGRVISCQAGSAGQRIVMVTNDNVVTTLVTTCNGLKFYSPNDVIVKSDGTIWFTDPAFNGSTTDGTAGYATGHNVYRFNPTNGNATCTAVLTFPLGNSYRPNGLCFSPDESILYLADYGFNRILVYSVSASGTLSSNAVLASVTSPDGIRCDANGRIYTSSSSGIYIYMPYPDCRLIGRIATPNTTSPKGVNNLCFGGANGTTLFIGAAPNIVSILLKVTGASRPTAPIIVGAASNPSPTNRASGISLYPTLSWTPGSNAVTHAIYLGLSSNAVAQATPASPEYRGTVFSNTFAPALLGTSTYYWRVDEMAGASNTVGAVWSFTTAPPPPLGLIHRYSFNETSGTIVTDSICGASWNGSLPSGGTFSSGQLTLASNASQYVGLPADIVSTLSNFTVEVWTKFNTTGTGVRLFDFGNDSTSTYMFLTSQSGSTGKLRFGIRTPGNSEQDLNGTNALSAGVWYHVALTLNGNTCTVYVNGAAVAATNNITLNPLGMGSTTNNWIGRSEFAGNGYLDGVLDEFRIYNRALSPAEIAATEMLGPSQILNTNSPPSIATPPVSQSMTPGCTASFTVQATGAGPLYYQWWKDTTRLNAQTNASLTITNVGTLDFGNYSVVVTSPNGWMVSSNALLALNHPPTATPYTIQGYSWSGIQVQTADLLTDCSDGDSDALAVVDVSPASVAGGSVVLSNSLILYTPPATATNSDSFTYTVSDGHCGGSTTATVSVQLVTDTTQAGILAVSQAGDGTVHLSFTGVPGWTYRIQFTESLTDPAWQDLATLTADALGGFEYIDTPPVDALSRYYRSAWP